MMLMGVGVRWVTGMGGGEVGDRGGGRKVTGMGEGGG